METEDTRGVCIGNIPLSVDDITRLACSSIPPMVFLDPKVVEQNNVYWEEHFKASSDEAWFPMPRPMRQPTMPTATDVGVGDASVQVVDRAVVRATAVIRIATLMDKESGVRMDVVQTFVDLLNDNKLPSLEASSTDNQALEKFATALYNRRKLPSRSESFKMGSLSRGMGKVGSGGMRSTSPIGSKISDRMKSLGAGGSDDTKGTLRSSPGSSGSGERLSNSPLNGEADEDPFVMSEDEAQVFCSGTAFTVAHTLLTVQMSRACTLLSDCATALTVESCRLPLSFIDKADTLSATTPGAATTSAPLSFPGACQSAAHILWLLDESKLQRQKDCDVDCDLMEALASMPMYSGTLTECLTAVFNILKAELRCSARRTLITSAIAAKEDRDASPLANLPKSTNTTLKFIPPESRRIETLRASVQSQVEIMTRLSLALLTVVEGCLPRYKKAAAEPHVKLLPCPDSIERHLVPLEANPITSDSLKRVQQRLESLRKATQRLSGDEVSFGGVDLPPPSSRGEAVGAILLEVLVLQICTSLQLVAHEEVRLYNDAVEKVAKSKKNVTVRLNMGKSVDRFREFAMDLLDRHAPPNKRDEMLSESEPILHGALGNIGLAAPEISSELEDILRPLNQDTRIPKVAKGTQDFSPIRMALREQIFTTIKTVFQKHGAVQIDTPVFELKETLRGKYGDDQKLIYDLKDQGGEQLSLRYDLTVPFARYVATHNIERIKRFHIAKVYRRDEPQMNRGRYREFYQCDVDIAGEYESMVADAEILAIVVECLRALALAIGPHFLVKMNHRKLLNAMLGACGVPDASFRPICSAIDKLDKESWEDVKREMTLEKGLPEETADKLHNYVSVKGAPSAVLETLKSDALLMAQPEASSALQDMETLIDYLTALGVDQFIVFDMSLARGLDYYTGLIYEAVLVGKNVGSIAAGGRYDKLVGMFAGRDVPAVGISLGIERIFRVAEENLNLVGESQQGDSPAAAQKKPKKGGKKEQKTSCAGAAEEQHQQQLPKGMVLREAATDVLICSIGNGLTKKRMEICQTLRREGIASEFTFNEKQKLGKQLTLANKQRVPLAVIFGESEIATGTVKLRKFTYDSDKKGDGAEDRSETEVKLCDLVKEVKKSLEEMGRMDKNIFGSC